MFINISNHPSSKWGKEQIEKAKEIGNGEVIDIPFPNIDPRWSTDEVFAEAVKLLDIVHEKVTEFYKLHYIHVMGESGFIWAFINVVQNSCRHITCVHSTTERVVEEKDGQKISVFRFVQFREY